MKKIVIVVLILFLFVFLFYKGTHSLDEEDIFKMEIKINDNIDILKNDMLKFIDLVDNSIIKNSSFNLSSKLNKNYDFLTRFAISFILENKDEFDIIYGDSYTYVDQYGVEYISDKYVSVDTVYEVTNKILGVEYYLIMDDNLIVDNKIVLIDFSYPEFNMEIDKISNIHNGNGYYDVYVKYKGNETDYIYRFEIVDNNRLIISNLSIVE
ncbi:MAG: hypothetical protein IJE89_02320 [Bacilli bacterium]|nr:hypothetical protein [Bacilli bacterium]